MDPLVGSPVLTDFNITACPANCTFPRGSCVNGTCQCEVQLIRLIRPYIFGLTCKPLPNILVNSRH